MVLLGEKIGKELIAGDVVAFDAPMGAGKTTLSKGIGRALEVDEEITSPTFTIISEYEGKIPLFHMDFYRIDDDEELMLLGIEEFFYGQGVSVVDGSGIATPLLPKTTSNIKIEICDNNERIVSYGEEK